jgi:nitronate monooxygenase
MRRAAAQQNDAEHLALWAGQGVALARSMGAAELVDRLAEERRQVLRDLGRAP